MTPSWETVIGLEVHVQLKTRTKLFCGCVNKYGADPNTLVCPICLGLPGVLPVLNRQAFALAVRAGVALGCDVANLTKFDRKNYYYPDLPKGYQISQYDRPLNRRGRLEIETPSGKKNIGITRIHLEEDAGKLIHPETEGTAGVSFVDLNRAGVPLVEIVSEPDMRSPEEAYAYLTALKEILQYVDVSDCDMEKGSLRCDANVSIRRPGDPKLGVKTEIKNLNSFRAVAKALSYEAARHAQVIESGGKVEQVTLTWDAVAEKTIVLRSKEEAHDYRYFPEPDLVHVQADPAFVAKVREALPERPAARRERYVHELGLPAYDAGVLTGDKELAELFDRLRGEGLAPKIASNWVMKHVLAAMNEKKLHASAFFDKTRRIAEVARKVEAKEVTGQTGGDLFLWILETPESASVDEHVRKQGLAQVSDAGALEAIVKDVIAKSPRIVADIKAGKTTAIQALVGQVMRETKGKANATVARELIEKALH
ncbi:MAG: Asp-tRNA(Asn)/Glu-tRNA(Gln) amidotransferase subunit GatB [Planctomycetia bacterium]|nr:Asp-tRNA(Asn)/Glu-tRNA(Gln) amidotransferase subunit GatB [Planctomycetia bacterium]